MKLFGYLLTLAALAGTAFAQSTAPVPEIDGGSLASGVTLLAGAMLVLRSRK